MGKIPIPLRKYSQPIWENFPIHCVKAIECIASCANRRILTSLLRGKSYVGGKEGKGGHDIEHRQHFFWSIFLWFLALDQSSDFSAKKEISKLGMRLSCLPFLAGAWLRFSNTRPLSLSSGPAEDVVRKTCCSELQSLHFRSADRSILHVCERRQCCLTQVVGCFQIHRATIYGHGHTLPVLRRGMGDDL